MRWASLLIASCVTMAISQAPAAQLGTAEGVAALARGDYLEAAAILKPIAEGWRQSDPMAEFFMGTLYETGQGVPQDLIRACALYHRATRGTTPFSEEAGRLFKALIFSHDAEWSRECQVLARIGFDHQFEPVTLTLAPGHTIAWDLEGATVTYQGKSRRFSRQLASEGSIFFPIRQTALASGDPAAAFRHFNEVFVWRPSRDGRQWSLEWHLFEIVRDELIGINVPSDPVVSLVVAEPPAPRFFDVRAYVDLRITPNGAAEWAILQGPRAGTGLIESDAERREVKERDRARDAASKLVDWKREQDANRPPSMAYVDADGCGKVRIYGWSSDHAEAIVLQADQSALGLSTGTATLDIARQSSSVAVTVHVYAVPRRGWSFCSDVGEPTAPGPGGLDETWRAVSGTLTIDLSPPGVRARSPQLYRATIRLTNAEFVNRSGARVRQTQPIALSAIVGGWGGGL